MKLNETELRYVISEVIKEISPKLAGYVNGRRNIQGSNAETEADRNIYYTKDKSSWDAQDYIIKRAASEYCHVSVEEFEKLTRKLAEANAELDRKNPYYNNDDVYKQRVETYYKQYQGTSSYNYRDLDRCRSIFSNGDYLKLNKFWQAMSLMNREHMNGYEQGEDEEMTIMNAAKGGRNLDDPRGDKYLPIQDRPIR